MGYLTVVEKDHSMNDGHMQLMVMLAKALAPVLSGEQKSSELGNSMLQRFLEGGSLSDGGAQHFLEQRGWTEKDSFRVYILGLDGSEDKLQLRRSYRQYFAAIAAVFPWDLSGVLEGRFVLLANDSRMPDDRRRTKLEELLRSAPVKGGVSLSRQGFRLLPKLFEQAEYTLQSPKGKKGFLTDYYYLAMDHLIRSPYDPGPVPGRLPAGCVPALLPGRGAVSDPLGLPDAGPVRHPDGADALRPQKHPALPPAPD